MRHLYFVTANDGKIREASIILKPWGITVNRFVAKKKEIQSDDLKEIVKTAAKELVGKVPEPFIVEDSGLFVNALKGFPGPYSSYVFKTIGINGILKLMKGLTDRKAYFESAVALCIKGEIYTFVGKVEGWISEEARGRGGFGFDPIFIPKGFSKTFAELSLMEKCSVSHRAKALRAVASFLVKEFRNLLD